MFRVVWADDDGQVQVNRGYRIQMSSLIGPYKGGLALPSLGQPGRAEVPGLRAGLKNSLTTLPMGGGKGGSDFDPHGQERRRESCGSARRS